MKNKIEIKSLTIGMAVGGLTVLLLGAATERKFTDEIGPLDFRVLSVTRPGDLVNGRQDAVLQLEPAHLRGMSLKSYEDFCARQHETRELTVITKLAAGVELPTNWIVSFQAVRVFEGGQHTVSSGQAR